MGVLEYVVAPENMMCTSEEKYEVYSFRVFLLELLTGLKPLDHAWTEMVGDSRLQNYVWKFVKDNRLIELTDPIVVEDKSCPRKRATIASF